MNTETKICPYCAEEINIEAIKCKHCKEFLNSSIEQENSSIQKKNILIIKDQNFPRSIFIIIAAIVLSFVSTYFDKDNEISWKILLFSFIAQVILWLNFQKYLENFKAKKAVRLISWIIVFTIFNGLFEILIKALSTINNIDGLDDILGVLGLLFCILIPLPSIILYLATGISLSKIKNDSVGLLRVLGFVMIFLIPIILAFQFYFLVDDIATEELKMFLSIISNFDLFIIIIIYIKAQKKIGFIQYQEYLK
ncbi:MAG: hypothetical protein HXX09_14190 [Bacteroidetes bacterium]|nr:hypothetical protein [Bacteroidota bacterium]